ncbi:SDR family oxidoreductase [Hydrogenophaga sp. SL48]|uniref:SDR family oxidoreductase n=1 Tax=Hydrogenophaga sp. SL48 TaxID=2806347 RepID=UPI001F0000C7|nr:SDR family oxidoreductase [Hydrogenophaga sp. SL48]UJW83060.1 SDR family oxidoreductase [Hydrogenophaga sp. SL48]
MRINLDFKDRHAVIFGGTTGINFGIADAFASRGATVTVVSRKPENVSAAVEQLGKHGGQVNGHVADVRDFDAVGRVFASAVEQYGPVDVLVSGAAGNFLCEVNEMSSNGFKVVVDIDLVGTFHVLRQASAYLRKPGASVINISAPQSVLPMRWQAHVCAAKAGVDQLTRVLALEWGAAGVRVNGISPGPIAGTEGVRKMMGTGEEIERGIIATVPLQRLGEPDDIANLALFLASPYAGYISGATIACDGASVLDNIKSTVEDAGRALAAQR